MAKLIIYRGDTLDREIDLGERNARVGRGDQNDIVLPDPAKSVSRFHAELRFEQGKYSIVDLNSQNGTWVAGRRVPQATLEPGVPVVLGTYRLVLKQEQAPPPSDTGEATLIASAAPPEPSTAATIVGASRPVIPAPPPKVEAPPPPPAPKPEPVPAPKPERPAAPPPPEPPPPPKVEPPKPAPTPEPPPTPKAAPPKPAPPKVEPPKPAAPPVPPPKPAVKPAPAKPAGKGMSKGLLIGGFVLLVLVVLAGAVFLTPLRNQLQGLTGGQPADTAPAAPDVTRPPEAQPATAPPATEPPPAQAAPPVAEPAAAPPPVVPAEKPVASPPRPARVPSATPGGRTTPAGGRRSGAAPEAKPKPLNLAQTLEEARSAMIKGDYLAAIAGFESILKVDPKYPSAADLLGVARGGAKNASQLAVDSGNKAEMGGDYAGAAKQYERALQLDPESTAAPDAMRRLRARMQSDGEDAFKRARQYDALGRAQDAIAMYEKAIQLLPADHASAKTAKERLAALKGGL